MTFVQFIHFDTDVKTCTDCEMNDEALQHIKLNYSISRRRVTLVFRYFRWTWEITGSLSRRATAWMRRGILGWSVCVRVAWRRYSVRNINTVLVIILAATTTANTGSKNILQISLFETPVYKPNSPRTYTRSVPRLTKNITTATVTPQVYSLLSIKELVISSSGPLWIINESYNL